MWTCKNCGATPIDDSKEVCFECITPREIRKTQAIDNQCPQCSAKLKTMFSANPMVSAKRLEIINQLLKTNETERCGSCIKPFVESGTKTIENETERLRVEFKTGLTSIPVATIQVPPKWDFEVMGIVTGQSVIGTGFLTELSGGISDFFGGNSEAYNNKLRSGEKLCLSQIKTKTLELGGNAVVGVDIDYSEVGGGKGMLMVCMAGTAINLKNIGEVQPAVRETINTARKAKEALELFAKFEEAFPVTDY